MEFQLNDSKKISMFRQLIGILSKFTDSISFCCYKDSLYAQGMDHSHVCMFELNLDKKMVQ